MLTDFFKLHFLHRFIKHPILFNRMWTRNEDRRHADQPLLRNNQEFHIPYTQDLLLQKNFPLQATPDSGSPSPMKISRKWKAKPPSTLTNLKRFFLNKLSADYTCNRLLCHCHLRTYNLISPASSSVVFDCSFFVQNLFLHVIFLAPQL